jgi:hypothetical protein
LVVIAPAFPLIGGVGGVGADNRFGGVPAQFLVLSSKPHRSSLFTCHL